jgi:hypothetical protein
MPAQVRTVHTRLLPVVLGLIVLGAIGHADRADAAGVTFGGLSSQDRPIVVEVTPRRSRVARVVWDWFATSCVLGPAGTSATPLEKRASDRTNPQRFQVDRRGRWSGKYIAGPFPDAATGGVQTFDYKLTGRFLDRGTRMRGTIRVTYTEIDAAGSVIRTCRTGPITFNLKD